MKKIKKKTIIIISIILVIIASIGIGAYCAAIWVADKTISTVVNNLYDPNAADENDDSNVVDISSLTESEITNILVTGEIPQNLIDDKIESNKDKNEDSSSTKTDNSYYLLTPAQARQIEASISDQDKIRIIQIAIEALPPDAYQEVYAILTDGGITASNLNRIYAILDRYLDGNQKKEVLALYSKYIYLLN